jgi:hypothetical protein
MSNHKLPSILITVAIVASIAVLVIPCLWAFLYFGVYIGYGNYKVRGHQEFAARGVSQIEPAIQMDEIFADCRHYITYGQNEVPLFNSEAYFGGRYQLTMQVPIEIKSASSGSVNGEPQFYLDEVDAVDISSSGQVGASFSRNLNFGLPEWQKVYKTRGNFSTIGFHLNPVPVANFQKYADAGRPSN